MKSFDDIIQKKANDHQAAVPQDAWNNIVKKKKKKRYAFFWWITCLVLSGLITGGYFTYFYTPGSGIAEKNIPARSLSVQSKEPTYKTGNNDKEKATINKPAIPAKDQEDIVSTNNNNDQTNGSIAGIKNNDPVVAHAKTNNNAVNNIGNDNKPGNLLPGIDNKKTNNDLIALKKKKIKSGKQKSNVNVVAPGTEELTTIVEAKTKTSELTTTVSSKNDEQKQNIDNDKSITEQSTVIKKDMPADSLQKKFIPTKTDENKTAAKSHDKRSKKNPWLIDLAVLPLFPIQQYDKSVSFTRSQASPNNLSEFSGNLSNTNIYPSIGLSISLKKAFNKRINIGTGLQYVQLKEQISITGIETNTKVVIVNKLVDGINGPTLVNDTIKIITQGNRKINSVNSYQFLSIPVFIQYDFIKKSSWSFGTMLGAYFNIYNHYKNEIDRDAAAPIVSSAQSPNNSIGVSLFGGIRLEKKTNRRLSFFGMPSFSWNISQPYIKNSLLNKKIHLTGIGLGISYKLN